MSRPSFRPRPIDLNKALPIIKTNRDLKHDEDNVAVARALPAMATGVDPTEEEERHLQQALVASIYGEDKSKALNDIPIPVVKAREYDTTSLPRFVPQEECIAIQRTDEELDASTVEYELDAVDEKFISSLPSKNLEINPDDFEVAMDKLEKAQGRGLEILPYSVMKDILTEAMPSKFPDMLKKEVYVHWVDRRTIERKGRPFLRLLQPAPDVNDPNPAVAFRYRDDNAGLSGRARQARQNSYENYKRLLRLRSDFEQLRGVLQNVIQREELKKNVSNMKIDMIRLRASQKLLPEEIAARESLRAKEALTAAEKALNSSSNAPKKHLRTYDASKEAITVPVKKKKRILQNKTGLLDKSHAMDSLLTSKGSAQRGIDQYMFDEKGRTYLRQMRYIAGLFATKGVSPYDHRVFSAALERGSLKDSLKEPKPVDITTQVKFAKLASAGQLKARARLGRLSRIFFDPVSNADKAQRGPASVGKSSHGWYSAGIPYDKLPQFRPLGSHDVVTKKLRASELEIMSHVPPANEAEASSITMDFWPSRKARRKDDNVTAPEQAASSSPLSENRPDTIPFYVPRRRQLILSIE